MQRATGVLGEQLGEVRDRLFTFLNPQRHHRLLDLNASTGLLTWEAVRRVPEGGVTACTHKEKDYSALIEQSILLDELSRPHIVKVKASNWLAIRQMAEIDSSVAILVERLTVRVLMQEGIEPIHLERAGIDPRSRPIYSLMRGDALVGNAGA